QVSPLPLPASRPACVRTLRPSSKSAREEAMTIAPVKYDSISLDDIAVDERLRPLDPATVDMLAESMAKDRLRTPIVVRLRKVNDYGSDHVLVAGLHRLEAAKKLGWGKIDCL